MPAKRPDLRALLEAADAGDRKALASLQKAAPDVWAKYAREAGDLAMIAEDHLIKAAAGGDLLQTEAIKERLDEISAELAGPDPSPLEMLVVQRIRVSWLTLHYVETLYAQQQGELSFARDEYYQRTIERAERRYLRAIKTLAQIRKLGPTIQVNLAERQVNIAQLHSPIRGQDLGGSPAVPVLGSRRERAPQGPRPRPHRPGSPRSDP